jgi:hypothetical protein
VAARVGCARKSHAIAEKVNDFMPFVRDILSTPRVPSLEALEARQLLAFGQADQSFGAGGRVTTLIPDLIGGAQLQDIEIGNGGDIVAGGNGGLVRWDRDGALDIAFGNNGNIPLAGGAFRDQDVASDGTTYVLVAPNTGGGLVIRYTKDGLPDSKFGTNGVAVVSTNPAFAPAALAVQDDGKVVVAGTVRTDANKGAFTRVYRLEDDGAPDLDFGGAGGASVDVRLGGVTATTPVEKDAVVGVSISDDDGILIGGSSLAWSPEFFDDEAGIFRPVVYGDSVFAAARLTQGGHLDGAYGAGGVARATYANGINPGPATAFAKQRDDDAVGFAAYTDRLVYAQFTPVGDVAFNRSASIDGFGRPADMAAKRDGRLMIVGVFEGLTGHGLQVAYISPGGELSNVVQTDDSSAATIDIWEDAPAAIAVADDGNILVGGRPSDNSAGYTIVKIDDGNPNAQRPDEFADARGNDIVRDDFGGVHFAYFDAAERVLKYAYKAPNGLWNAAVTVDAAPESGHYLSIAVDASGRPGIAYFDGTMGDLKYAFSPNPGQWDTQVIESAGLVGLYPSLAFDSLSRATVSYYKKTGGDLKLAVLLPEGVWAYELIDEAGDVGRSTDLVPQPISGRWSIAYTDSTTNAVKLAWWTKLKTWQVETAATTAGGADYLSLAYNPFTEPAGVFDKAAISYYDAFAGDLKITQSDGVTWTSRVLSTQGTTGFYSALTFDAFYGPTVYFYNRSADKVTRITDSFYDGITADTVVEGGGRFLSVFSNGTTVDLAYFDDVDGTLKVRSIPVKA